MIVSTPHFLLFSESRTKLVASRRGRMTRVGRWRFVLQNTEGPGRLEAEDEEEGVEPERLELLAVVRGLEALDQPSHVTLITPSRYVARGFRFGLDQWRENDWRWECYGEMIPIKNADLWQRVDRALEFHDVECRMWRVDGPQTPRPKAARAFARQAAQKRTIRATGRTGVAAGSRSRAGGRARSAAASRQRKTRRRARYSQRLAGTA